MRIPLRLALVVAWAATGVAPVNALDTYMCESAISDYESGVSEIDYALRAYVRCVESSEGRDDCDSEYRSLGYAQDAFSSAVSYLQIYCDT